MRIRVSLRSLWPVTRDSVDVYIPEKAFSIYGRERDTSSQNFDEGLEAKLKFSLGTRGSFSWKGVDVVMVLPFAIYGHVLCSSLQSGRENARDTSKQESCKIG